MMHLIFIPQQINKKANAAKKQKNKTKNKKPIKQTQNIT